MKKIIYILPIFLLYGCFFDKNTKNEDSSLNTGTIIEIKTDDKNLKEVKNLLEDENTSQNNSSTNENTESGILNDKELKAIENTNSGEIDNLIDTLFQDLN